MKGFDSSWYEAHKAKSEKWQKVLFTAAKAKQAREKKPKVYRPLEKEIQKQIAAHLDKLAGCYYVWHRMDRAHTCAVGTPDFVGVWRGVGFAIEAKRPGENCTPEQSKHLIAAAVAGIKTMVAFSLDDVKKFLSTFRFDNRS